MAKVVIEIVQGEDGKIKYAMDKSGVEKLDKLGEVAVGSMNLFAKTGGNVNNLIGTLGAGAQQGLMSLLGGSKGGLFN